MASEDVGKEQAEHLLVQHTGSLAFSANNWFSVDPHAYGCAVILTRSIASCHTCPLLPISFSCTVPLEM